MEQDGGDRELPALRSIGSPVDPCERDPWGSPRHTG